MIAETCPITVRTVTAHLDTVPSMANRLRQSVNCR